MDTEVVSAAETLAGAMTPKRKGKSHGKLTESVALLEAALAKRTREQVLVTGVKVAPKVTVLQPSEFSKLNIDESYQRARLGPKVNDLITVLRLGGQIPDPIDVAERPDGTMWIIDGQQRFWAHYETSTPLKANIHLVSDMDAEKRLFVALNSRRGLTPRVVLKGWPGLAGNYLRGLNTSDRSPLKGMIDLTGDSKKPFDGPNLARAILTVLTGADRAGDTATDTLPRLDKALKVAGATAWADEFIRLVTAVFGGKRGPGRVRVMPLIALAHVAHRKYKEAGRPVFPRRGCSYMRNKNWDNAVPSYARKYLPMLELQMEKLWR